MSEACFIRRISVASNAIQTIDNEVNHLIIYCLNCIRRDRNATYKTGLSDSAIDISYTLDSASHIVGRRKLKPDRRRWSFPQSRHGA